ncbi:amidohydrolase [Pseudonocardia sp. GCM10023141]|uniref:amidohydrolase n=1 Tax=Pseudonocardia sp. GCM10023141 TaxID=3252653 RepID=UPI00360ECACD
MNRTLLLGATVVDPVDGPGHGPGAVEITGHRISFVGTADEAADRVAGATVLELDGAVLTPAFVDAHVHATATGLLVDGLDLTAAASAREVLDAVAARAATHPGALVWGHGWQEQDWPDPVPSRAALDRAAAGAPVYLSRIDVHSALVSTALLDRAPDATSAIGWSRGPLAAAAHHLVRRAALDAIDPGTRGRTQRAFLAATAARGVAVVHECAGPDISSAADLHELRALAADPGAPEVVAYWGEAVTTAEQADALLTATGAHGLAGDLFIDGSIGSHTAALREPYTDAPGERGRRYLDPDAVGAHVLACTLAGVQAGFHVIGDAAADILLAGLHAAARATSTDAVRAAGHRVEHLEMVDAAQAAALHALGVVASVQPQFDALWGGPDGMYAERLGPHRAAAMNPFAALQAAGVALAFGSDSPVTPVDPWATVRAAAEHRTPGSAVAPLAALAAHTVGGHRAAGDASPRAGRLVAGAPASYAIWDGGGPLTGAPGAPRCLRTVHRGRTLHDPTT